MNNISLQRLLTVIAMSMFVFAACGDDPVSSGPNDLIGTWIETLQTTYYGSLSSPDSTRVLTFNSDLGFTITFESDNTWTTASLIDDHIFTETGIWSATETTITWNPDGQEEVVDYEISGNKLSITSSFIVSSHYTVYFIGVYTKQ